VAKFKDYYAVLGVQPRSHARVIEERYWEMAHGLHNDLHEAPTKKMQKRLHQINEAYEVLGSPHKRSAYDRKRMDYMRHDIEKANREPSLFESFVLVLSKPFRPD
jgi:DnaJ-class molecular chaperone